MENVFEQLKEKVLPYLTIHQNDLLIHDKVSLKYGKTKFLYGYRKTGTDILQLWPEFRYYRSSFPSLYLTDKEIIKNIQGEIALITGIGTTHKNENFLYYDGKELKEISLSKAKEIHARHIREIVKTYKSQLKNQLA